MSILIEQQLQKAFSFLDGKEQEMISLLETFVNQESGNNDQEGCNAMVALVEAQLKAMGAETQVVEMGKKGNFLHGTSGVGRTGSPVLFSGHLDTVFPRGTLAANPFRQEGDVLRGPGCLDMKSGIVIALYAAAALNHAGYESGPIRFACPSDEENGHRESTAYDEIRKAAEGVKAAFSFETGYPDDGIVIARKGSCRFKVRIKGIASHSGNAPEKGRNAILEMAHKVIALQALNDLEHGTSVNVGIIQGGVSANSVPADCEISVDIRYTDRALMDKALDDVREICAQAIVPDTKTELDLSSISAPMKDTKEVMSLFNHCAKTARKIGYPGELRPIKVGGWSDACIISEMGIPVVCGMGAKGAFNHSEREYAEISSLVARAKLTAAAVITLQDSEL